MNQADSLGLEKITYAHFVRLECRYHFVTTTCAIIGGIFTVAGIVDGLVHTGARLAKKVELGKHT